MLPDSFYILRVRTERFGEHLSSDAIMTDKGDLVDAALSWDDAIEIDARLIVGEVARPRTKYVTDKVIQAILDGHDFTSGEAPTFPPFCRLHGLAAYREARKELLEDEAHIAAERSAFTSGAVGALS